MLLAAGPEVTVAVKAAVVRAEEETVVAPAVAMVEAVAEMPALAVVAAKVVVGAGPLRIANAWIPESFGNCSQTRHSSPFRSGSV
jgi:hypothetical protein